MLRKNKQYVLKIFIICLSITLLLPQTPISFVSASSEGTNSVVNFKDIKGHWAESSIITSSNLDLVKGYDADTFGPNDKITKEQFIAVAIRTLGVDPLLDSSLPTYSPFNDVANDKWSAPSIKWAVKSGWIQQDKYTDFKYDPTKAMTREEASSIMKDTLLGADTSTVTTIDNNIKFVDDGEMSNENKGDIYFLSKLGIIQGFENKFRPKDPLTRAEATVLLLHVLSVKANISAYTKLIEGKVNQAKGYALASEMLQPNANSLAILGATFIKEEKWQEAIDAYTNAKKSGYTNPYADSAIAYAYYNLKDFNNAYQYQIKAIPNIKGDIVQEILFAQYCLSVGKQDEALNALQDAKTQDTIGFYSNEINGFIQDIKTSSQKKISGVVKIASFSPTTLMNSELLAFNIGKVFKSISDFVEENKEAISIGLAVASIVLPAIAPAALLLQIAVSTNSVVQASFVEDPIEREKAYKNAGIDLLFAGLGGGIGSGVEKVGEILIAKAVYSEVVVKAAHAGYKFGESSLEAAKNTLELWNKLGEEDDKSKDILKNNAFSGIGITETNIEYKDPTVSNDKPGNSKDSSIDVGQQPSTKVGTKIITNIATSRIAVGWFHSLALKSDGTVVAWGANVSGETTIPARLTGVVSIAAGLQYSLALKSDGTVVAWGRKIEGETIVLAGLSGVVSIAAGASHSLALKSNGTVIAWGEANGSGAQIVPVGLSDVVSIAAGATHSLALKSDGTVVAWGSNLHGQSDVPAGLSGVVSIAAGNEHSLALKSDGTVVAWGRSYIHFSTNPPAGLTDVVSIAAGLYSLALKSDGTVVAWGVNRYGHVESNVPVGLTDVVSIAAGYEHYLASKSDGTVVAWGASRYGQTNVPSTLTTQ